MTCPSCQVVIDGSSSSRGHIWCRKCSRKICTEKAWTAATEDSTDGWDFWHAPKPPPAQVLVWKQDLFGKRFASLVDALAAKGMERVIA